MMLFFESPAGWVLMILSILIAAGAQLGVKSAYNKYSRIQTRGGITGAEVARRIVAGSDVTVEQSSGHLSDHFNPRTRSIGLSPDVFSGTSVAALGIAAHEAGHALQHKTGYLFIKARNAILPVAQLGSTLAFPLVFAGHALCQSLSGGFGLCV